MNFYSTLNSSILNSIIFIFLLTFACDSKIRVKLAASDKRLIQEDSVTVLKGSDGKVNIGDASVFIPAGALGDDSILTIRRVVNRNNIAAYEIKISSAAVFEVSIVKVSSGEVLRDDELSSAIKISQNVSDLSDRTQLQFAYATVSDESSGKSSASLIMNSDLEISDAPRSAGIEQVSVTGSIARANFMFTVPDYETVANRIPPKKDGPGIGNPVLDVSIATNVSSADGSVYFAKNAFTSGRIRLRSVQDLASKITSSILLGATQGLNVETYVDEKFTIKLDSLLPGFITLTEETSKLNSSKAEIAYVTDLGLPTQEIYVIPNDKLIFEPQSNGKTSIRFSVNESNFTSFLIQTEPSNPDRQKWGSYEYASTPRNFTARSTEIDRITMDWESGIGTPATGFVIGLNESDKEPQSCTSAEKVVLLGNEVTKTITGLKSATTYSMMICSKNGAAISPIGPSLKYRVRSNVGLSMVVSRTTEAGNNLGLYVKGPAESTFTYHNIATVPGSTTPRARASLSNGTEAVFTWDNDGQYLRNKIFYGNIQSGFHEDATFTALNVATVTDPKIALTSQATGNIRLLFWYNSELRLYSNESGSFTYERVDTGHRYAGSYEMVIDRNDHVHVLYNSYAADNSFDYTYKKRNSSGWVNETNLQDEANLTSCTSGYRSISMMSNDQDADRQHLNYVHIVYQCFRLVIPASGAAPYQGGSFYYINNKSGLWSNELVVFGDEIHNVPVAMRLGFDNSPHVLLMNTFTGRATYSTLQGDTFSPPTEISMLAGCLIHWGEFSMDTKSNNNLYLRAACGAVQSEQYIISNADGIFKKSPIIKLSDSDQDITLLSVFGARVRSNE